MTAFGQRAAGPRQTVDRLVAVLPVILAAVVLAGGFLTGCRSTRDDTTNSTTSRALPNIVLVVLDTVGSGHMSAYGYDRETTPEIARLLPSSRLFTRAYSTSSWTVPAHASMFTGLYPVAHRATQENWTLADHHETLAEILTARGYETLAAVANPMLSTERGFDQGFSSYVETWRDKHGPSAGEAAETIDETTVRVAAELLAARDSTRPLFLFVNLIGAHSPYDSCGAYCETFVSDASIDNVGGNLYANYIAEPFTPELIDHLRERYDAEILQLDHLVGRMVATLREQGVWDDTVFVLTSDHGENFGYQGHVGHVFTLNDATTRVPLLLRHPATISPGSRDDRPVQVVDLFPTLLRASGADATNHAAQGLDLSAPRTPQRPVLLEYYRPLQAIGLFLVRGTDEQRERLRPHDRHLSAIVVEDWKLIEASDGTRQLYDLGSDPTELSNLAGQPPHAAPERRLAELLSSELVRHRADAREPAEDTELDETTRRALEAIGYLE